MFKKILLFLSILGGILFAQEKGNFGMLFKCGVASNSSELLNVGTSDAYSFWNIGPHAALGAEYYFSRILSLQLVGEYSAFSYDNSKDDPSFMTNDARNTIADIMLNLKVNLGLFYFLGGAGYSYQKGDAVIQQSDWVPYSLKGTVIRHQHNASIPAGLLGFGLDIPISKRFDFLVEYDFRIRAYLGTAALAGMKLVL